MPGLSLEQQQAIRRWKRGHQAFHVLLAAMNTRLEDPFRLIDAGEWDDSAAALLDLARLYDAATSVMRYTTGFRPIEYETLIRPSMMPPFVSPGFSGVLNQEHAVMLAGLRSLRTVMRGDLSRMPGPVGDAWQRLHTAQKANRAAHVLICREFVGDGASLLREFLRGRAKTDEGSQS